MLVGLYKIRIDGAIIFVSIKGEHLAITTSEKSEKIIKFINVNCKNKATFMVKQLKLSTPTQGSILLDESKEERRLLLFEIFDPLAPSERDSRIFTLMI